MLVPRARPPAGAFGALRMILRARAEVRQYRGKATRHPPPVQQGSAVSRHRRQFLIQALHEFAAPVGPNDFVNETKLLPRTARCKTQDYQARYQSSA